MNKSIPRMLYKYRNTIVSTDPKIPSHIDMLESKQVYFSHPSQFNDPFDCLLSRYYFKTNQDSRFEIAFETWLKDYLDKLGIFCLSADCMSKLMWAHYADNHRGFCIGFKTSELPPIKEKGEQAIKEIKYMVERARINVAASFRSENIDYADVAQFVGNWLYVKSLDWKYEKEWRLIGEARKTELYDVSMIGEIIFGLKMTLENKETIMRTFKNSDIAFSEVIINPEKDFALDLKKSNLT